MPEEDMIFEESLSARRAWIEISIRKRTPAKPFSVALRKESVDRNVAIVFVLLANGGSLSARRAWIEIRGARPIGCKCPCRSPQGERG